MRLRIHDLREDHDLTQQTVAEVLMCDQSLYSKYERGERPLPLDLAIKLADLYNSKSRLPCLPGTIDDEQPCGCSFCPL